MRAVVTGNITLPGMDPLGFSIDAYGNAVDYEPVLHAIVGGLIALRARLAHRQERRQQPNPSLWAEGSGQIGKARRDTERAFRMLGDGLDSLLTANDNCLKKARQSVSGELGNVAGQSQQTVGCLVGAAELCRRALRFGEQGSDVATKIREHLDALERMSRHIHSMENHIQEQMRPAEVVQVLLRIECARLDEVARAPLEALGVEIARTCEKMNRTMAAEFQLVEETHQTVVQMIEHVRNLERRQQQAQARRGELAEEMDVLGKQAVEQAERDQMLNVISAGLEKAVSQLIGAMQYQDIVGQRWEHVEQGFASIASSDALAPETGFQALVQQAQLVEANSEMAAAICGIDDCLKAVGEEELNLGQQLDFTISDQRRQAMNVRMHAVLYEVWDMVRSNEDEMKATDQLIAPLVQVAGRMGCQIGSVSHEMRLIALNAQVQAARFGASTGLEVLAEALRQIADAMGEGGNLLDSDSRRIEQIARDLRVCFETLRSQSSLVREECERDFPAAIHQLSTQEESCNVLLREAKQGLESLGTVREQMERSLAAAIVPLEGLAALAHTCGDFVEKYYRGDHAVKALLKDQLLDAESSRYTMAAEKEVLLAVAGKSQDSADERPGEAAVKPSTGELDLF